MHSLQCQSDSDTSTLLL